MYCLLTMLSIKTPFYTFCFTFYKLIQIISYSIKCKICQMCLINKYLKLEGGACLRTSSLIQKQKGSDK